MVILLILNVVIYFIMIQGKYILINLNGKKFKKLMDDFKFVVLKVFVYFVSLIFNINFVDDIFMYCFMYYLSVIIINNI